MRWRSFPKIPRIFGGSRCALSRVYFPSKFWLRTRHASCSSLLLTLSRVCFTRVEVRHLEASGPGTAPDQSPPRGEDEEAEGRGGGESREKKEEEGEARQGVQARSRGGEAAARHP